MIRDAVASDAAAIAEIYAHHVTHGTASFDTEAPDTAEWARKIDLLGGNRWPFLVAEREHVVGYAYATQFRDRAAYARTCENSIYVAPHEAGGGIGTAMLQTLVERAGDAGFTEMVAVIGGAEPASVALHAKLGFEHVGRLRGVGLKFGRLLDAVYMQRSLGPGVQA